ncbi:PD-(D/E)XK nuclease-like domain-containing protein [Streptomyces aidingensis]|uniref:Putative exodeoxyribonuclease 8 PDDEXK-like domain-containing protein n=1 Tax=Streptomyces aidingensis TaxID=910347 RepID=A0A1I1PYX2_9ACTN|nr:PD-(D/E)XK nuclease-like domain-containing protein [Streptomyces aidingensis]SFD12818.1 PDDEXK-like protein of unknown function [Streptomyces aidingensis]
MTDTAPAGATTAPAAGPVQPGQYDIPAEQYHADPVPGGSLSSSGARQLLAECPAKFAHDRAHGSTGTRAMEFGTAAHTAILGIGPDIVRVDAKDWRTKQAQQQRDAARAEGAVPLLAAEYDRLLAMADALQAHPRAAELFAPGGEPEQTFIWQDGETGVWCRSRVDWLPPVGGGRLTLTDYKTTVSASPRAIAEAVYRCGYHQQAAFYLDGIRAVLGVDAVFEFVFQEKTPPYVVTVARLDLETLQLGAARNRRARHIFAECQRTGIWPDWGPDTHFLSLPPWAAFRDAEEYL